MLQQLLDAALHAPSAGFSQPREFVLTRDKVIRQQVKEIFTVENEKAVPVFEAEKQSAYTLLKLEGIMEASVFYQN